MAKVQKQYNQYVVVLGDDPKYPSNDDPDVFGPFNEYGAEKCRKVITNDFPGCEIKILPLKSLTRTE